MKLNKTRIYCTTLQLLAFLAIIKNSHSIIDNIMELKFVNDYFDVRDIRVVILFTCSVQESLDALNVIMKNRTVLTKYDFHGTNHIFKSIMSSPYVKLGIYVNCSCEFGKSIVAKGSKNYMYNEEKVWILVHRNKSVIHDLQKYSLRLDSDLVFGVVNDDNNTIVVYDVYLITPQLPLIVMYAGYWNEQTRLTITMVETKTARRSNFQGITINGTGVLTQMDRTQFGKSFSVEQIMDVQFETHLDILNRFAFIMNMNLAKMHNFTMNVTFADDWGIMMPNGEFNGMLGEVASGRSELGLSTVIMNTSLMDIMDFSFPIWKFRPMFMLRSPRTFGTYEALLIPFKTEVWIAIVCLIIFLICVLTLIRYLHVNIENEDIKHKDLHRSWSENLVTIIGAFSVQGLASCSTRIPERIILYTSLIVGMLLYTFYNSMVVTSLLQPLPSNIHTCEQLLESGMMIGITNITYYIKYFQTSNDELTQKLLKKASGTNGFISPEQGVELVKKKDIAFYGEEAAMYPIINDMYSNNDICRLVEVELVTPYYLPCPYRKGSPLKQFVNSGLHLMRERGIISRERRQWHRSKPVCQGQNDVPSIQLHTLLVAFIILLSGVCLSIFIFMIEILSKRKTINNKKKRRKRNVNLFLNNYNEMNFHI